MPRVTNNRPSVCYGFRCVGMSDVVSGFIRRSSAGQEAGSSPEDDPLRTHWAGEDGKTPNGELYERTSGRGLSPIYLML